MRRSSFALGSRRTLDDKPAGCHIAEHSLAMAAVAVQLTTTRTMAYDLILLSKTLTCDPVTRQRRLPVASFPGACPSRQSTEASTLGILSKRFFTKVRRFKQATWYALLMTDIVDSFCFKAVSRADSQFQIVNRAQQGSSGSNSGFSFFTSGHADHEVNESFQLFSQNGCRTTNRLFRLRLCLRVPFR